MHALTTHSRAPLTAGGLLASIGALCVLGASLGWGPLVGFVALVPAAWAAVVDLRTGRLPNSLVAASAAPAAGVIVREMLAGDTIEVVSAVVVGAVLFAGPLFVIHVASPDSMGFGDVKLAAALGATLGLVDPWASLVALCVASAATATIGLVTRRTTLSFGPGLVGGAAASFVLVSILEGPALPWR
jgi:leader peptidase (prepilin peptidase)/N-methyltransferase